jgi:hypothetical protein
VEDSPSVRLAYRIQRYNIPKPVLWPKVARSSQKVVAELYFNTILFAIPKRMFIFVAVNKNRLL